MSKAMRLWGAALGVLVAGTLFVRLTEAQSVRKPPVLEASRVVIRDAEGRVRGMIGVTEDNEAGLSFFDVKGRQRCRILVEADGPPKLALAGPDETSRIGLAVQNDGAATLRVGDSAGEIGIVAEPGGEGGGLGGAGADRPHAQFPHRGTWAFWSWFWPNRTRTLVISMSSWILSVTGLADFCA
jgi:hypothetical protein